MAGKAAVRTEDIQLPNHGKKDPRLAAPDVYGALSKATKGYQTVKKLTSKRSPRQPSLQPPRNITGVRG